MSINEKNKKRRSEFLLLLYLFKCTSIFLKKYITYVKLQILKAEQKNDIAHKWLDTSLQLQNLWMAFFFHRSSLTTF